MTPRVPDNSFQTALEKVTAEAQDGDFFIEDSRSREAVYVGRAFRRWQDTLAAAQRHLGATGNLSVLDIGVSPFTLTLPDFFGEVYGLDLTDVFATRCSRRGIKLISGGVHDPQVVAKVPPVDCIFFLEAIEHLHTNPVVVLQMLRGCLKPNGILIVSTPNMMCFGNRLRMLFNRKLRHFDYPPFQAPLVAAHGFGHDRIYCPAELEEYMKTAGHSTVWLTYPMAGDDDLLAKQRLSPSRLFSYAVKLVWPSTRDTMLLVGRK
jgi:hypothetical protein